MPDEELRDEERRLVEAEVRIEQMGARVRDLEKKAHWIWVLGAVALVLGLTGGKVYTKMSNAEEKIQQLERQATDIEESLSQASHTVARYRQRLETQLDSSSIPLESRIDRLEIELAEIWKFLQETVEKFDNTEARSR